MVMSATKEVKILLYCQNPIALVGFAHIFEAKSRYRVAQVSSTDSACQCRSSFLAAVKKVRAGSEAHSLGGFHRAGDGLPGL
jgi:hypothetical protein